MFFLALIVVLAMVGISSASDIVSEHPGISLVQDDQNDLWLVNCDPNKPNKMCSIPPEAPLEFEPWADVKTAKMHQIGRGLVDLSVSTYGIIPSQPPHWFAFYWQFEGGCYPTDHQVTDKDSISVVWDGQSWSAHWNKVLSCNPRICVKGDPVDFWFEDETVRVRIGSNELFLEGAEGEAIYWFAATRRMSFIHPKYERTQPLDRTPEYPDEGIFELKK
jgi:hypothetical protein